MGVSDAIQTLEAAVNDVVFFGIAVFFVLTIETRVKRRQALEMLHALRSLAPRLLQRDSIAHQQDGRASRAAVQRRSGPGGRE